MATIRKPPRVRMTLAEFLRWEPGGAPARAWQLVDGEPVAMAPGSRAHGAIQAELCALLRNRLLEKRSSCQVAVEPGIVPDGSHDILTLQSLGFSVVLKALYRTTWMASA